MTHPVENEREDASENTEANRWLGNWIIRLGNRVEEVVLKLHDRRRSCTSLQLGARATLAGEAHANRAGCTSGFKPCAEVLESRGGADLGRLVEQEDIDVIGRQLTEAALRLRCAVVGSCSARRVPAAPRRIAPRKAG